MEQTNQGVEATQVSAPSSATGVETTSSRAPENDPTATIAALQEKNAKQARDLENYRNVALSIKGKQVDLSEVDWNDPLQRKAVLNKEIEEQLLERGLKESQTAYDSEVQRLARENKELKASMMSKQASTSIAGGAGAGAGFNANSEVETHYVSPDQLKDLRKRAEIIVSQLVGLSPDKRELKIKEVMAQYENNLKSSAQR